MTYPNDFVWGAATASYQVEGAAFDDGKKASVWDMMCRKEGAIFQNQNGDVACDHYHRYQEDVAIMKAIGLKAYRFSISWPRVLPDGVGKPNPKGLDFYERLVDELLAAGIDPYVTLFHWDFPYALYQQGGWLNPSSPDWMAEYTRLVVERLSDRVRHWLPLNEPPCYIWIGLKEGRHAPGDRLGLGQVLTAAHHAVLGGSHSVQAIRQTAKAPPTVGMAWVGMTTVPDSESPEDIEAARQAMFSCRRNGLWSLAFWADPLLKGDYPVDAYEFAGIDMPEVSAEDRRLMLQPLDFFGFNLYQSRRIKAGPDGAPQDVPYPDGYPVTAYNWPVTPEGLYWAPRFLWERYSLPMMVTENGMGNTDWVSHDGKIHDPQRIDFTRSYLLAMRRAIEEGIPVKGYFHWSLLDNFEWAEGYRQRFGLVHVDYATQKRTLKDSAFWYQQVIATNGSKLDEA